MKHPLLLLAALGLARLSQAQITPLIWPVPEKDPTVTANRPLGWLNGFPAQRPAWVSLHNGPSVSLYRYTYNAAGLVSLVLITDSLTGQLQARQINTYNAAGKLVDVQDERWQNGARQHLYAYAHTYDAHGNLTRTETGGAVYECSYTYDAAGTITQFARFIQQPGQARTPHLRITFGMRNGRWQSCTQEEYQYGAWETRRVTHRYNWRNWPQRQLHGSRWTDYYLPTSPQEKRDTVRYAAQGTDSLVYRTTEQFDGAGSWNLFNLIYARVDAQRNLVAQNQRVNLGGTIVMFAQDSSAYRYDAQGQLRRQRVHTSFGNPGPLQATSTVYYGAEAVTGTAQPRAHYALTISPNPATHWLTLRVPALPEPGPVQAEVLNALGQVVEQRRLQTRGGALLEQWDVHSYPAGLYVLRLRTADGLVTQRFIKE